MMFWRVASKRLLIGLLLRWEEQHWENTPLSLEFLTQQRAHLSSSAKPLHLALARGTLQSLHEQPGNIV